MIDLEKAKSEFERYSNTYDREEYKIESKHNHSYRVMDLCGEIAEKMGLSKEEADLARLIGLLHDIARYDQWTNYKSYNDLNSFDHGDKGVEILSNNDYLRWYIDDEQYDDIIKCAIKNHNKYILDTEGMDEKQILFSKIVRDADKIDILYESVEYFWIEDGRIDAINKSYVSKDYYSQITNFEPIKAKKTGSPLDDVVIILGFIFDLNFKSSKEIIIEKDYINKLYNRFNFEMDNTKMQMGTIKDLCDREIRK